MCIYYIPSGVSTEVHATRDRRLLNHWGTILRCVRVTEGGLTTAEKPLARLSLSLPVHVLDV